MNEDTFKNWDTKKKNLKKEYPHITDEDLAYEVGKESELVNRLKEKLNKSEEQIHTLLSYIGYE